MWYLTASSIVWPPFPLPVLWFCSNWSASALDFSSPFTIIPLGVSSGGKVTSRLFVIFFTVCHILPGSVLMFRTLLCHTTFL
uniref:Putative product n=1 Tax=Xenopsylla cheopis TaxID=163159 RepID=A0A6M2E0R5_XENCH